MVAKDAPFVRRARGDDRRCIANALREVADGFVAKVACKNSSVVGGVADETFDDGNNFIVEIDVEVREVEKAESIKRAGQAGKVPRLFDDADIEKPTAGGCGKAREAECRRNQAVEREDTFDSQQALALMEESGFFLRLLGDPPREEFRSDSFFGVGGRWLRRLERPSGGGLNRAQNVGLRSGVNAGGVPSVLQKTSSMRVQFDDFSSS